MITRETYFTAMHGVYGINDGACSYANALEYDPSLREPEWLQNITFCILTGDDGKYAIGSSFCENKSFIPSVEAKETARADALQKMEQMK